MPIQKEVIFTQSELGGSGFGHIPPNVEVLDHYPLHDSSRIPSGQISAELEPGVAVTPGQITLTEAGF